jgi:hypothetical protein
MFEATILRAYRLLPHLPSSDVWNSEIRLVPRATLQVKALEGAVDSKVYLRWGGENKERESWKELI